VCYGCNLLHLGPGYLTSGFTVARPWAIGQDRLARPPVCPVASRNRKTSLQSKEWRLENPHPKRARAQFFDPT